jgi:hypothetical protein
MARRRQKLGFNDVLVIIFSGILPFLITYGSLALGVFCVYATLAPTPTVGELHTKVLSRYYCYSQRRYDGKGFWLVLETSEAKYILYPQIFDEGVSKEQATELLQRSTSARVWLEKKSSRNIVGIETDHFRVPPENGLAWERKNKRWGVGVAVMLFLCGGYLHFTDIGKMSRDILRFYLLKSA